MTTLKPSELARKRLEKRTQEQLSLINKVTPKRLLKSPSQKKSEAARKKELKRAGIKELPAVIPDDCRDCQNAGTCGTTLNNCTERSLVIRCKKCGMKVRVRVTDESEWTLCPVCRS